MTISVMTHVFPVDHLAHCFCRHAKGSRELFNREVSGGIERANSIHMPSGMGSMAPFLPPASQEMTNVFQRGIPFKIINSWILPIKVLVVDLRLPFWIWNESLSHKSMNEEIILLPILVNLDGKISIAPRGFGFFQATRYVTPDAAVRRHAIKPFKSGYVFPHFSGIRRYSGPIELALTDDAAHAACSSQWNEPLEHAAWYRQYGEPGARS